MGDQSSDGKRAVSSGESCELEICDSRWLVRVDTGGTFTDGWARSPEGEEIRCKVLSSGAIRATVEEVLSGKSLKLGSDMGAASGVLVGFQVNELKVLSWDAETRELVFDDEHSFELGSLLELVSGEEAPLLVARMMTRTPLAKGFPKMEIRVATTRATNALLERKGAPGALLITKGFEDLLQVRDQRRPEIFGLEQVLPLAIFEKCLGVGGRISSTGNEIESLDLNGLKSELQYLKKQGVSVVAVALLNAYANNTHEQAVGKLLNEMGFGWVSLSHELSESMRLLTRSETAVTNAYLAPIMEQFVERLEEGFGEQPLALMSSAGCLQDTGAFRPIDSLLSGPAGGAVGALAAGKAAGIGKVLAFDMGGTSTDVSRLEKRLPFRYEQEISGVKVLAPAVRIETVAAGGGSICRWHLGALSVGPESAGADPGPACYGRGGPLTVTDVNLLLGYMEPEKAGIPVLVAAARVEFEKLKSEMLADGVRLTTDEELLEGIREIAVEKMADAIHSVSLREGADPAEYGLVAFGGAGPQHACAVADKLGVMEVLVPGQAGILSAWGLHCAVKESLAALQVLLLADEVKEEWMDMLQSLSQEALDALDTSSHLSRVLVELRLLGQDSAIEVEKNYLPELQEVLHGFATRYEELYGYPVPEGREVEVVAVRVVAAEARESVPREEFGEPETFPEGGIVQDHLSTCIVAQGWSLARGTLGSLRLRRRDEACRRDSLGGVVEEELYRCRFERVVEEMGELLRRTALSTNIKERLDYSCALLDGDGRLVVNAPHIPVHLGALGLCVRTVSQQRNWSEGDMVVVNHPGYGGSHLPDVTVISPIFHGGEIVAYVANRAHHAEIGGLTPGSMPASARCLAEEGVVIPPTLLFAHGEECFSDIREIFQRAENPSRNVEDNLADLAAQAAANRHGVQAVSRLITDGGVARLDQQMEALYQRSSHLLQEKVTQLPVSQWGAKGEMDDGTPIQVSVKREGARLQVSFEGSGAVHPGNLNATAAVLRSAVLYVLRLWVDKDVPLNEGLLHQVEIDVPTGFLNPKFSEEARACPAVVGGNVETSQRVVDVLLQALGIQANGQGTMNNLLFGNDHFGYYETIGGGGGAGPSWNGISGCHVHMSNTAITDPEVLEHRFPLRLHQFSLRKGSGGCGCWTGGEGLIREIEFLEPMTVSVLTQRRLRAPQGCEGGGDGQPGVQWLLNSSREKISLPPIESFEVEAGTRLHLETPGGGGWGTG